MNFELPDLQGFIKKKKNINLLGEPSLEKSSLNGIADREFIKLYKGYTNYELILRDAFQMKLNLIRKKNKDINIAVKEERKVRANYKEHIQAYRNALVSGESIKSVDISLPLKKKEIHTELVFCFDASFGMYHPSLFLAVNKFLNLLNSIKLDGVEVAIVTYGGTTATISEFTSSLSSLLLKSSLILPVGGLTVIFDNFKLTSVSDNNLAFALKKAFSMFLKSASATRKINRHLVILSNGNLSGVTGSDTTAFGINKELRYAQELEDSVAIKKEIEDLSINISSISIQNNNENIVKEISQIIFWQDSISKINNNIPSAEQGTTQQVIMDLGEWTNVERSMPGLNFYFIPRYIYSKEIND